MSKAHERKKQPELVRANLIANTIAIAAQHGYEAVTFHAVAKASGVSKGGLIHHFASKFELVNEAFRFLMERFDEIILSFLEGEKRCYGVFTRAYIQAILRPPESPEEHLLTGAVPALAFGEREIRHHWLRSHNAWLKEYADTDDFIELRLLRAAADGLWWDSLFIPESLSDLNELLQTLLAKTRQSL